MVLRNKRSKNPPILSQEFFIQNHADIISCVAMLFILGFLLQVTAPIANMFVMLGHNVTSAFNETTSLPTGLPVLYTYGGKDACAVFFYLLITIVFHAIIQEYALDKINRRLHLSKVKHSKFNESGQLLIFYVVSVVWGGQVILAERLVPHISKLWIDYPHTEMTFLYKFFFIIQIAYWIHCYPELYFQKTKKEEIRARVTYATLYLVYITAAYVLNFTRVGLFLLVVHYSVEAVFHASRLCYFTERTPVATVGFKVWNGGFVFARLASIILSVLTFWYGLSIGAIADSGIDIATGAFNTKLIRMSALIAVCALQAWMMWTFINFHLKRRREREALEASLRKKNTPKKAKKDAKNSELNELPEVDQHRARHNIRSRKGAK